MGWNDLLEERVFRRWEDPTVIHSPNPGLNPPAIPKGYYRLNSQESSVGQIFQNGTYDKFQKCKEKEKKSPLIYEIFISMTHTKGADRSLLVT